MKTVRGVEYKLKDSEYKYSCKGLSFYFSSKFYLNKFVDNVENFVENELIKFESRYKVKISLELLLYITYYKKIEKRGFRIIDEENNKELTENVGFGIKLIMY